jgi:hypothetical protein
MDTEGALMDLEAGIKRRSKWRGRWVFYQVLEAELAPILAGSADPDGVRARARTMLERYGHAPDAPPLPGPSGDAAPLCKLSPKWPVRVGRPTASKGEPTRWPER